MLAALSAAEAAAIGLSLRVALVAILGLLPLAFGLAWLLARRSFPGKSVLDALVLLPLVMPPVVTGYLLLLAFGPNGPVGSALAAIGISIAFRWTGAALAAAVMALPLVVGALRLAIEAVDPRLEAVARTLGASRWRAFATVTLPLTVPGIVAGAVLGFAKALGEFGATQTFVASIPGETQTIPLAINALLQVPGAEPAVLRLVLLSVAVSFVALLAAGPLSRRATAHRR